ncbi:MAG: AmmeMemoRadiSam system protein B [Spirochaetaceae bacterium]|nr:AmmeMemoRadiSam system protein B [Spirochaetaceae bacterium]
MRYTIDPPLPRVRHVDVIPVDHDGSRAFYVRDPLEFAPQPIVLGAAGLMILSCLDGRHTMGQVRQVLRERLPGADIDVAEIHRLLRTLSRGCFLHDRVSAERIAQVSEEFARATVRPAWHAGRSYPDDAGELAAMFDRFFVEAKTAIPRAVEPAAVPAAGSTAPCLAAVMCPHIDLRAGGAIYPPAFAALAAAARDPDPIELYVILGVAHHAGAEPGAGFAIATDKDYATPFGRAPTGRSVIEEWSRRAGRDVTDRQTLHRTEHSVEFPLLFLHYIEARAGLPPYEVGPVLLGSVDPYLRDGSDPLQAAEVAGELQALREGVAASGKRALYVLSVDLAHIGPKFGDPAPVDDAGAASCEQADRALLDYAQRFDSAGLTRSLAACGNNRNVDAVSGLYSLYPLLGGGDRHGTLLAYGQNRQPDTGSLVSYASMAFYQSTVD